MGEREEARRLGFPPGLPPGGHAVLPDRAKQHEQREQREGEPGLPQRQGMVKRQGEQPVDHLHVNPVDEERRTAELLERAPSFLCQPVASPRRKKCQSPRSEAPTAGRRTLEKMSRSPSERRAWAGTRRRRPGPPGATPPERNARFNRPSVEDHARLAGSGRTASRRTPSKAPAKTNPAQGKNEKLVSAPTGRRYASIGSGRRPMIVDSLTIGVRKRRGQGGDQKHAPLVRGT